VNLPEGLEPARDLVEETKPNKWQEIVIYDSMSAGAKKAAIRLNALGSLYYFSKVVLGHNRLSPSLHGYMCRELERDTLRMVMEIPRDHFKTTVASVSAPMWWALDFSANDEDLLGSLGYSEEWIRWMRRAHYSSTRTLIASETIGNARKIGVKIDGHYLSNAVFRFLFPRIIPKDTARWNQDSMTHNRLDGEYHGEGTYDFIGVKGALQSRHYNRQIVDDAVGEKAIKSEIVMETTIDWVKKLPGAFDSDPLRPHALADQLFIGNRWSHRDLGTWLRKNDMSLQFITHSADGGCERGKCKMHPPHVPIFPEEFTLEKLAEIRAIEGAYNFAAQFRNDPVAPEAVRFKETWLRHYSIDIWKEPKNSTEIKPEERMRVANWGQLTDKNRMEALGIIEDKAEAMGATPERLKKAMVHEVKQGEAIGDIRAGELDRFAFMDPNHSGEFGRARNAILVIGVYNRPPAQRRIYLLDCWAKACNHEEWLDAALSTKAGNRGLVVKWRCHSLYIESEVAGQQGWKYAIKERMRNMGIDACFSVRGLKTDRSENAKTNRIIGMESIYENGFFWVRRVGCEAWMEEYSEYPNGATLDLLDLTGYLPQTWGGGSRAQARDFVATEMNRRKDLIHNVGPAGY
jgi:hypothetical protein